MDLTGCTVIIVTEPDGEYTKYTRFNDHRWNIYDFDFNDRKYYNDGLISNSQLENVIAHALKWGGKVKYTG